MAGHFLAARSLNLHEGRFNWVFLLWYIVSSVLAILFLFYFNRLFASVVSYGIRAYTWHRYRVYIDVQALQFSLLAGRIFFKGLRYQGQNETVLIHDGYITWRYWLRHVQELDCDSSSRASKAPAPSNDASNVVDGERTNGRAEENGGTGKSRQLPCRVLLKSRGVEWFIYNRSPAYDTILHSMRAQEQLDHARASPSSQRPAETSKPDSDPKYRSNAESFRREDAFSSVKQKEDKESQDDDIVADSDFKSTSIDTSAQSSTSTSSALPGLLNILPIRIECSKGAVVMGNRNTHSILTAKFDSAAGQIDARTSGAIDNYKQTFDFDFFHPVIEFKHNKDYIESPMADLAQTFSRSDRPLEGKHPLFSHRRRFRDIWTSFCDYAPYHRGSVESLNHARPMSGGAQRSSDNAGVFRQNRWLGLTRYLDDDDDLIEQERWKAVEYGAYPTIVDSPKISMSIYWDVPGLVPDLESTRNPPPGFETDINGDTPPEWGIELKIRGGTISYGPWADRQRADLQAEFFPTPYKNAVPAAKLRPGQPRVSTVLKIMLEVEEQTTIRVPTREDSKDWKWKGCIVTSNAADAKQKKMRSHAKSTKGMKANQSPEVRPYGWLDVKLLPDSTVSFAMDLVARSRGYRNHVDLDLKGVEMSSSVNHGLLWRSQSQVISCDLSNPLGWNALHQWHVDIKDNGLELFMLRDHMFLLTDLISDWTSGPLGEFHTFVPFEYSIGLRFAAFKLYLNANDSNIINNPSDIDDNTFVVIWGQELKADLVIPSKLFRPVRNRVTFDIEAIDGGFELRTPPRTTLHTYLNSSEVASLKDLKINGSYTYFATTSPSLTDILLLNVLSVAPRFNLYGFFIRYLMKIKDNYFGDDIHFRTLEEYQSQIHKTEGQNEDLTLGQHSRLSNDLDVILGIAVEDSCALLPAHLYSAGRNVRLEIPSIGADLRITNYYMDLAITFSPIAVSHTSPAELCQPDPGFHSSTQVFIDGLEVFGHRLFGLPPTEPTYVCNWDFDIGYVRGECSVDFLHCLSMALRCFTLSFDDAENALPPLDPPIIHDVTFLRARVRPVLIGLVTDQTAFLLSTQEVKVEYNDRAGSQFSDRLYLLVPDLALSVLDAHGVPVDRSRQKHVGSTHAYVKTTLKMSKVKRKVDFDADRCLQRNHIALHDSRTRRVPWLVLEEDEYGASGAPSRPTKSRPPAMTFPSMPEPVSTTADTKADEYSVLSYTGLPKKAPSRRSSFLSTSSSRRGNVTRHGRGNRTLHRQQSQARGPHYRFQGTEYHPTVESRASKEGISALAQRESHIDSSVKSGNFARSGLAFTSPYKQPYFPLLAVQPDFREVPISPKHSLSDALMTDSNALNFPRPHISDRETEESSFIINSGQGVQTLCTPEALLAVTQLLARFQTTDEVALLDNLQLDTMTDVLSAEAKRTEGHQIFDVRILVPLVSVRFISTKKNEPNDTRRNERYDVILENLTVTSRSSRKVSKTTPSSLGSQSSFHIVLDRIACSAREHRSNNAQDQAILSLSIWDPVAWMWHGTISAAELQFQTLEIESASRKVDHIPSLLQQTLVMSEDFAQRFRNIEKERKLRLRLLVLLLTVEGKDVPDPPFLTRASYVLRSASHHLRASDSWRIMSRLRYIHRCLPAHSQDKIHAQCVHKLASCPEDAESRVSASFDHWRISDLTHVRSSLLMQRVFGQLLTSPARDIQKPVPTKATLRAGALRILVDPGPSQNEVAIEELIIGIALCQPNVPQDVSFTLQPSTSTTSTIQVHCAKIAVRLHWALLELIKDLIETIQATQSPYRKDTSSPEAASRSPPQTSSLHLAVSSDASILTMDTKNLKLTSLCKCLRISSVSLHEGVDSKMSLLSVLVYADVATSEIQRRSTSLILYKLRRPKVFGSKDGIRDRTAENLWKVVGSGQDMSFLILANPLQLIGVADSVLEHEVVYINQWLKSLQLASSPVQSPVAHEDPAGLLEAHVALSLDSYLISLAVLPSLTYQIRGKRALTSFRSAPRGSYDSVVDIDLKEHSHVFRASANDTSNELSTLHMPPVNAHLGISLDPGQKSVAISALIESIVFDASAVHAILTTINRPEMVSLGENIMEGASSVRDRYKQIHGTAESRNETLLLEPILYNAYVTLLSLSVQAHTSDALSIAPGAQLQVKMGRIQLKTTNRALGHGPVMRFPEAEVQLKGIQLSLLRFDKDEVRACGDVAIGAVMRSTSKLNDQGELVRAYQIQSSNLYVNVYTETAPVAVAVIANLQDTLKTVDLSHEVQALRKLGHARLRRNAANLSTVRKDEHHGNAGRAALFNSMYSLEMTDICVAWKIGSSIPISPGREPEDLILSFAKIDLSTKKDNAARLLIQDFQLQMVPHSNSLTVRSKNSALLPEVVFNVAYVSRGQDRRLAFQAAGKSLDLRLTSHFILPASDLRRSIALSIQQVRTATSDWNASATTVDGRRKALFSDKKLASLLVDADFAGAVVFVQGRSLADARSLAVNAIRGPRLPQHGRYNQFTTENANNSSTTLRAPGIAFKVEYRNGGPDDQSLNAEMKIDASSNILFPTVVPLIMEISSSIKDVVGDSGEQEQATKPSLPQPKFLGDERLRSADPVAIFGNCKLNLGLRICRQEFSLSCQPIARVAATARFEDIYITVNTVQSNEHGRFFTVSAAFTRLQASVQHVYSRESTGNFVVNSIVISLMNSKHVSTANGISAILKISPMKAQVNAKQSQDFLLFREIWVPPEIRRSSSAAAPVPASESQAFIVQRYQHIAAAGAFPWNATVAVTELDVQLDLGQSLGKSAFSITGFWISSKKRSNWEQNLCLGFNKMAINSTGRMSGFVELQNFKVRTSIQWPVTEKAHNQTPLVQASLAFDDLRVKASFDYQAFLIADITRFEFLMYNVRDLQNVGRDRIVGVLDGDKVQVFCTTTSASQAIALYQAFQRLYQEKLTAYETSLRDIEKFLRRKSSINPLATRAAVKRQEETSAETNRLPLRLQTNVVVTLKSVNIGAFPSTFVDSQIFRLEAFDASARFAVVLEHGKIHSTLGMTLGQVRVALASVIRASVPKTLGEVSMIDIMASATNSRGGTILKVPKLVASMETWQNPESTNIDYIFKSSFQGKVDVGWNYSRISYIRGMWTSHVRSLAQRLGKPLPQSAVQITGGPQLEGEDKSPRPEQEKITAVVNVPQSKYQYTALQPPIIETPQLRDMGEATPPLEWIGLHRERLPNLTHQIVIVTLLEVAKEVDDAYSKILGSS